MVTFFEDSHRKEHFMLVFLPIWLSSSASYSVKQSLNIMLKYVYSLKYRFYLSIFFPKLEAFCLTNLGLFLNYFQNR